MAKDCRRRAFLKSTAASVVGITALSGCLGELTGNSGEYPSESIRYVVPFSAGGGTDIYARQIMPEAGDELGVSIEVENISGAAGLRGQTEVFNAEPDGYTFGASDEPLIAALVNDVDWDPTEFEAICGYGQTPFMVIGNPDSGFDGFDELVEQYQNGQLNAMAGDNPGGFQHVVALIMESTYDLGWENYVGYSGSDPITQAVANGEVPAGIVTDTAAKSAVESDLVEPLAITSSAGSNVFPDVPAVTDLGYESIDYVGGLVRTMWAPPDTPGDRVENLTDAIEHALSTDAVQEWSEESGNSVEFIPPERAVELREQGLEKIPNQIDLEKLQS